MHRQKENITIRVPAEDIEGLDEIAERAKKRSRRGTKGEMSAGEVERRIAGG